MQHETNTAPLRIQLTEPALRELKTRAVHRGIDVDAYGEMIFRYAIHETGAAAARPRVIDSPGGLYFTLEVSPAVRQRLVAWSEREESNLAAFSGVLIQHFIRQFEKDPRDLSMIHYVSCLLDQKKVLSDTDLRATLDHCDSIADLHLSPDYVSKWFYSRLKPLVRQIEREGELVDLSMHLLDDIIRANSPGHEKDATSGSASVAS